MNIHIKTRSGKEEKLSFDKILNRLEELVQGLDTKYVSFEKVAQKTIDGIYDGVTTTELDNLSAEVAAAKTVEHPDYAIFAGRIAASNIQKNITKSFSENIEDLYAYVDKTSGEHAPLVSKELLEITRKYADRINAAIDPSRDFGYTYFGIKTLERSYLLKRDGVPSETPQYMFMRVALGVNGEDIDGALEMYDLMSKKYYKHATPTLFNSGTQNPQLSSCFLVAMQDDSIDGIYGTLGKIAGISKFAGGIGFSIHNIRAKGSYIKGTGGRSNGIVPMLRVYNETARYVDQGGGKRKGAFAAYLEPWHADIFEFLELKKNHGKEEMRARDLFYALWIPDLFMERVEKDEMWSLMDPHISKGLYEVHSEEFEELYKKYEAEGKFVRQVKAREVWDRIIASQIETGTPYMLYKDASNRKSNQKNLGTIRSSNLCAEIIEYSDKENIGVCNLAALVLPSYINRETMEYDFQKLYEVARVATRNLDKVIDVNFYTIPETKNSNMKHRPIGLGVNGLADVFHILKIAYDSPEAQKLNREIFETMYFAALTESVELAKEKGKYSSFDTSPAAQGILQFDLWEQEGKHKVELSGRWDWDALKEDIKKYGLRNSLTIALMPTASSSGMYGYNESFEPYNSNLYLRRTLSGEYIMINQHLIRELIELDLWSPEFKNNLMAANGSIQDFEGIPEDIKNRYKTVWELSQKVIIDMAADRGAFVDQSQSMNIHMKDPTAAKITSMHFYGWKAGLKTGMYYLRTQAARDAIKFTVVKNSEKKDKSDTFENQDKGKDNLEVLDENSPNVCISCSV